MKMFVAEMRQNSYHRPQFTGFTGPRQAESASTVIFLRADDTGNPYRVSRRDVQLQPHLAGTVLQSFRRKDLPAYCRTLIGKQKGELFGES